MGIAISRLHSLRRLSPRPPRRPAELCAMHALAALLSANACSRLHANHTTCGRPGVPDARAHLPVGRMRWQVHTHKCARTPPHMLALRRCAHAHMKTESL
eukprot:6212743-Pleurochrysis_carterae.AAC.3